MRYVLILNCPINNIIFFYFGIFLSTWSVSSTFGILTCIMKIYWVNHYNPIEVPSKVAMMNGLAFISNNSTKWQQST